jgi:alanine-glyoxylate transaminase/serine-glyoxylate transaminase/serine-pyruvate transaminase
LNTLDGIEEVLLMGPGPSRVPIEVYAALGRPTLGHLDPYFIRIMDEIKRQLQTLMRTRNEVTFPVSATGSAGMEACLVNLVEPGDRVLVLVNGVFGMRLREIAIRLGAQVDELEFAWGTPVVPEAVERKLKGVEYKLLAMVHAETSTGVCNPAADIGDLVRGKETLYLLDAVTSLGGIPVEVESWGVDALYSASQKCLSCPPGLAPVSFSRRAVETLRRRRSPVPNWYLDVGLITQYWAGGKRAYHHTAPVNMLYGLYQALFLVLEEGLEAVFQRHQRAHQRLAQGLEQLGLQLVVDSRWRLPMLNAVAVPERIGDEQGRGILRSKYRIEIGGGLGPLAGKIWRIGLMGHAARDEIVDRLLAALSRMLRG